MAPASGRVVGGRVHPHPVGDRLDQGGPRITSYNVCYTKLLRGERRCDAVWVVSASPSIQAQRVLRRPGMTRDRLKAVRARQMADAEKRKRARNNFV